MMFSLAWIAGFAGMLVWLSRAGRSARTRALEPVPRATVILAAAAVAALGFSSAYVFGARVARTGMDKILAQRSAPDAESDATRERSAEPPRARLFLRHVQLQLAPAGADGHGAGGIGGHQALIGYSPEAAMRLPRGYGLDEAKQGWDLLRVRAVGPQGLRVEPVAHPEATSTRVMAHAERRAIGVVPSPESIAMAARSLTGPGGRRCGDPDAPAAEQASAELDGPGALFVIICQARSPTAALVLERDLLEPDADFSQIPVRVTPLVWRGGSWRPHHVQISSGSLLQIGTMADALPGVTLWEVPAPAGRAELFYPPDNLLASCPEWLSGRRRQGFYSYPGRVASGGIAPASDPAGSLLEVPTESRADDSICVLPFTPPFGLEVRRLLPDVPGIGARSFWVAGLMTTPALLFLLLLCARPRSQISRDRFRRLLALGWIACLFAAIGVWRLLWAHRIDMLRDYESVGPRVLQNQVVLVLGAAALVATGVLAWFERDRRRSWRALAGAFGGWLVWLSIGGYALRGDWAGVGLHGRIVGQSVLSLTIGTGLFWLPHWQRALRHVRGGLLARKLPAWLSDPRTRDWAVPMAGLGALCIALILADALAPRAVLLKLALAWLFVIAVYSALRASIGPYDMATGRASVAFALGGVGALLLARFDPGVTVAIAGPGLLASLLFASHDARFADSSLRKMASYQRHHAPLLLAHAGLLVALGVFVIGWSLAGLWTTTAHEPDAMLARACTMGAIYSTLFFAALFVAAAVVSYLRRGLRAAVPWLLVSALMGGLFLARDAIIDRVLASSSQAAHRIAIVLDPGYALLHDESKFSSGITAWRETIMPATAAPVDGEHAWRFVDLLDGQGYFGAQLIDPGVLLSVENDYFPVLLVREAGMYGLLATALLSLILVAGLWIEAGNRFRHGSDQQRTRALVSLVLGVVCVYQPLASLGILPLTGISWPGFGLDSPSDFWVLMTIVVWVLLWGERPSDDHALDEFDRELRASRLFRKLRAVVAVTAAVAVVASLLLCARAAAFALRRPNPVDPSGRTVKPFDSLERAVDYAFHLQCPWSERLVDTRSGQAADWAAALVPDDILGDASPGGVFRFHSALRAAWQAHRARAIHEVAAFLERRPSCGLGGPRRAGPWTFEPSPENPDECSMRFKTGWPEIELVIERDAPADAAEQSDAPDAAEQAAGEERAPAHSATCGVDVRTDIVRTLRFPARRPYRDSRIRLVARAMGDAARDRGELISGHLIVRLREGAGRVDVSRARSGWQAGEEVHISKDLVIALEHGQTVLRRAAPAPAQAAAGDEQAWLLMREPPNQRDLHSVQVLEAEQGSWKLLSADDDAVALERLALLVIGRPDARSLWLFRPPSPWPGEDESVDPLLADDISTVRGERRRHYLFGGLVPEIGWVNPFHARMSLGLDGWVRVAMSEYEERGTRPGAAGQRARAPTWLDRGGEVPYCATLAPVLESGDPGAAATGALSQKTGRDGALDAALARICRHSPLDGVLECRVSVQPELSIRLRHLTELISLDPARYSGDAKASLPARANFALMRGDTGEIVAQGEFVPGRASSAYAPATPEIEQYLIRLREDRDPKTGRRLEERGEASAEKIDWNQPIAVGSTMKPLMGHALELADPGFARALVIEGSKIAGALCRRMKAHAIFGHCPPTDSLWGGYNGLTDMSRFISASVNWYQAAVGLLGTAAGERGTFGFGADQTPATLDAVIARNIGDYRLDTALWTNHRGQPVILADRTMRLDHLRETPLWSHFEAVLGRPLCGLGQKAACERQSARKDLCAARALPIDKPTSDLRHLVALGPSTFDFYPRLRDPERRVGASVSTREYLQFLRGSGLHPLGSLLQLTDAFNRVVYEYGGTPVQQSQKIGFALAASWFPVAARGRTPAWSCANTSLERDVSAGLCEVVRTGTADEALGPLLGDPRFVIYGAKTGTIDSLADVAENPSACAHYAIGHTIPDRPADAAKQPYWLPCTKNRNALRSVNDSLLMISLAVRADDGEPVPLTLGLRFQRSGSGLAARVARHYLDVIHDYFAPAPNPTDKLPDDPDQP